MSVQNSMTRWVKFIIKWFHPTISYSVVRAHRADQVQLKQCEYCLEGYRLLAVLYSVTEWKLGSGYLWEKFDNENKIIRLLRFDFSVTYVVNLWKSNKIDIKYNVCDLRLPQVEAQ